LAMNATEALALETVEDVLGKLTERSRGQVIRALLAVLVQDGAAKLRGELAAEIKRLKAAVPELEAQHDQALAQQAKLSKAMLEAKAQMETAVPDPWRATAEQLQARGHWTTEYTKRQGAYHAYQAHPQRIARELARAEQSIARAATLIDELDKLSIGDDDKAILHLLSKALKAN